MLSCLVEYDFYQKCRVNKHCVLKIKCYELIFKSFYCLSLFSFPVAVHLSCSLILSSAFSSFNPDLCKLASKLESKILKESKFHPAFMSELQTLLLDVYASLLPTGSEYEQRKQLILAYDMTVKSIFGRLSVNLQLFLLIAL